MPTERFEIPVEHRAVESVGAVWQTPGGEPPSAAFLLGHGAGAPMDGEFLQHVAERLVERGAAVLRFRYPYAERMHREERRLPPDRAPALEAAHAQALAAFDERAGDAPRVLGGKSLGGRIASHLVADGADCHGLVFFGYPLHPAKQPERLRSAHFPRIECPALFLQGSRDALGSPARLREELSALGGDATLRIVEGADHDFRVPKRSGRTRAGVLDGLVDAVLEWQRLALP